MYFDVAYAPFGEAYAVSGTTDVSFTGQNQDTVGGLTTGLYDFPAREYSTQGRWPSPDPAGLAAVTLRDPQSWNRYAYVRNSPLNLLDPLGLFCVWDDGSYDSEDDAETGTKTLCEEAGGTWFDGSPFDWGLSRDWSPNPNAYLADFVQWAQANNFTSVSVVQSDTLKNALWNTAKSGYLFLAGGYIVYVSTEVIIGTCVGTGGLACAGAVVVGVPSVAFGGYLIYSGYLYTREVTIPSWRNYLKR